MNGRIGVPAGGFPEPLRSRILKGKPPSVPDGQRNGQNLPEFDFIKEGELMAERSGLPFMNVEEVIAKEVEVSDYLHYNDLLSYALYP